MSDAPRRVLVPSPADDRLQEACRGFDPVLPWRHHDPAAVLRDHARDITVVANPGEAVVDAGLMDELPRLGLIAHFGVGYDSVDVKAATERGVVVTNVGGANEEEVADTALGLMLMTVRRLGQAQVHVRSGRWAAGEKFPLTEGSLTGARLGLLGMGRIGQAVARRGQACTMTVSYHARHERDTPYRYVPRLVDLARDSDVLVVATPGGAGTEGLVSEEVMDALGPQGVLINVARGSVVDERALVRVLGDGRLGGAGLDVFADEPHVPQELIARDDVVVLPHVGSATLPTRRAMAALARRNIESFLADGTVLSPVPESEELAQVSRSAGDTDGRTINPPGPDREDA